jgi:plasmid stabilization system protein ParE
VIKLRVHEAAALSIVEQADYIREKSGSVLAIKWEAAVDDAIRSILKRPEIGSPCRFSSPLLAGLRWTLIRGFPKHMVFYRYLEAEKIVPVVQVLHGARDIKSIFSDEEDPG